MCDYSLKDVHSRPAQVGDKIVVHDFKTGTTGFKSVKDVAQGSAATAICILPGTELAFGEGPRYTNDWHNWDKKINAKTAVFCQVNKDEPDAHHDALEFSDGKKVYLTALRPGEVATVLQLGVELRVRHSESAPIEPIVTPAPTVRELVEVNR